MTRRGAAPSPAARARGFTLVELMVAITIGLILTVAVITLFLGQRTSYGFQEGLSRVQENGRFASQLLARELRMAGHFGCARNIFNWLDPDGDGYIESLFGNSAVFGWEFSGTAPGDSYTIGSQGNWSTPNGEPPPVATALPGSDIILINRGEQLDVTLLGNPGPPANTINTDGASGIPQRTIIMAVTGSCSGGDLWQKTNNASGSGLPKGTSSGFGPGNIRPNDGFTQIYDDDAQVLRRRSTAYFIAEGAGGEPALFRVELAPPDNGASPQELVEGIETMQVLYGMDASGNRTPDAYVSADQVTDWNAVVSVRISLLVRSTNRSQTLSDLSDFNVGYTRIRPTEAGRLRQVYSTTIGIRNRLP